MNMSKAKTYSLRWWTPIAISLSVIVFVIETSIPNGALPTLQRELQGKL